MRERIFQNQEQKGQYLETYRIKGVLQDWYEPVTFYANRLVNGMIDTNAPGFKRRSAAGELVNNPMWKFIYSLKEQPLNVHMGGCPVYNEYEMWECFPPAFMLTTPYSTSIDSFFLPFNSESIIAQTKAWADVDVSEIQGLASLGEMPETLKMLVDLLRTALELTIAAKSGNLKVLRRAAKKLVSVDGLSDVWLLYRYGIRPLMADIRNVLSAVKKDLEKSLRYTSRGKFDTGLLVSEREFCSQPTGNLARWPVWKVKTGTRRVFRAGVLFEIDQSIDAMSALWGLDSPIESAWELIPFSFILDWFVNVGDCLGAAVLNPSLKPRISWVTESLEFSELASSSSFNDKPITLCTQTNPEPHFHQDGSSNLNLVVKRRCTTAAQYSLPRLNLKLDYAKLTDLILIARKIF